jgi:hypothetical protein
MGTIKDAATSQTGIGLVDEAPPPPQLGLSRLLQHSTIRIECRKGDGSTCSGTGFHFEFRMDGQDVPLVVTNRHVVDGATQITFTLTLGDENKRPTDRHLPINYDKPIWIDHPDASVDLVVIPLGPLLRKLEEAKTYPFWATITPTEIPSADQLSTLTPLEEVLMIGYPNGLWDHVNNLPIFRRGISATACNRDYQGRREFLIDAAVFPGSSGSPVFIYNEGSYAVPGGLALGSRVWLIGIVYAVHLHTAEGEIKTITIPTETKSIALSGIPNHLGVCIRAERILEFEPILRKFL